jgi:hypothetical protein
MSNYLEDGFIALRWIALWFDQFSRPDVAKEPPTFPVGFSDRLRVGSIKGANHPQAIDRQQRITPPAITFCQASQDLTIGISWFLWGERGVGKGFNNNKRHNDLTQMD